MKYFFFSCLIGLIILGSSPSKLDSVQAQDGLLESLVSLGYRQPDHFVKEVDSAQVQMGYELITKGKTRQLNGKKGKFISKYFSCLSCHNTVQEDPDPSVSDPEARLSYAIENNLPFLQATTFKGIVSRESWYNDDYEKKYGDLVKPARHDLREAIQLCATQCAQGRLLEDWEMKAILHYFHSIDYKISEVLNEDEIQQMNFFASRGRQDEGISFLKSKYLSASPAHFGELPESAKEGYPYTGDPQRGAAIFELSCQHCHRPEGESAQAFFFSELTFNMLENSISGFDLFSFYPMIRKGTYAGPGHRPYMPHYPLERMSDQQVEDLRAFIEQKAD